MGTEHPGPLPQGPCTGSILLGEASNEGRSPLPGHSCWKRYFCVEGAFCESGCSDVQVPV